MARASIALDIGDFGMRLMYVAAVEVETRREVDLDEIMRTLGDYGPTLGVSTRGWVEVQIRFTATGLAHACTKAAALARAATGAEAIACEVMTQQEHIARHGPSPEAAAAGRHAASAEPRSLPRQATETWERAPQSPGRHSA
ncbi:MAG: hypothetical protein JWR85_3316 [Marmoricola sp.]|nr:hypothetical protein [Marmoricola sp.]